MKNILVLVPMRPDQRALLEQQLPDASYTYTTAETLTPQQVAEAQIILGNLPPALLAGADRLEWLQLHFSGVYEFTLPGVVPDRVQLTCATGTYGLAISEYLLAQTFALKKKLHLYHRNQMQHLWKDEGDVTPIQGSTTLVVGLGDIGSSFAKKMNALGSRVYGIRRHVTECPEYLEGLGTMDQLDQWLPLADTVALCLPGTPATTRVMDARRLALMKPGSILLNVGRGTAVDTDALFLALHNGPLYGAALDVTDPEPLPPNHPLWSCPGCLLTPHVAGDAHLPDTLEEIIRLMIRNLGHYARGEELEMQVDRAAGYRKFP